MNLALFLAIALVPSACDQATSPASHSIACRGAELEMRRQEYLPETSQSIQQTVTVLEAVRGSRVAWRRHARHYRDFQPNPNFYFDALCQSEAGTALTIAVAMVASTKISVEFYLVDPWSTIDGHFDPLVALAERSPLGSSSPPAAVFQAELDSADLCGFTRLELVLAHGREAAVLYPPNKLDCKPITLEWDRESNKIERMPARETSDTKLPRSTLDR
jgi:hypothetical protein